MFAPRDIEEQGHSGGTAAALLPQALALPDQSGASGSAGAGGRQRFTRVRSLADHYLVWRDRLSERLERLDLAPDLAENIGSGRWFRGAATLLGLSGAALLLWPDFAAPGAVPAMRIDGQVQDEFRSQMIMPLGLGADTGRRMAATAAVLPLAAAPERPTVQVVATLSQGDSFARMLQRAGVSEQEAGQIVQMIERAMPLGEIAPGTKVDMVLGRRPEPGQPRPLDALSFRARFDLELAVQRNAGGLALERRPILVDETPLRIRGQVGSSLYRSARAAGAPANAVQKYLRTLGEYINLDSDIRAGDEFDLIVAYRRAATGESQAGDLLYAGIIRDGKPRTQLMRWGKDGQFFEASGAGEQRSGLIAPVPGRITSRYGMRRHPILGYRRMHQGLDFRASYGTPIYAVTDGRVQMAGRNGGHGNYVRLDHGGGLATGYSHMSRIAVNPGQSVRRGQVIGYVGSTGLSTGPHLHYEMYRGGRAIDPSSVQFVTRAQLSGQELARFRARLEELQQVAPGAALASLSAPALDEEQPVREIDRAGKPREIG